MAKVDVTKQIGEHTFQFHHISVRKLNRLFIKISKLVAGPLSKAGGTDGSMDIIAVVQALSDSADEVTVDSIIDELLSQTLLHGVGPLMQRDNIESLDLKTLWMVVKEAGEVYFGDFLQELLAMVGGEETQTPQIQPIS